MNPKLKYICLLIFLLATICRGQEKNRVVKQKDTHGRVEGVPIQNPLLLKDTIIKMKQIIKTTEAPAPIGPYNQAVKVGNTLYISGQIAIDPSTGQLVTINIIKETNQVMYNLMNILKAAGMDFTNVVKTTIFLKDMNDFSTVNEVYGEYFKADFPARETVEVSRLPKDVHVEISMIAVQ